MSRARIRVLVVWVLVAALCTASALLALRVTFGPVHGFISERTTLNFAALAFVSLASLLVVKPHPLLSVDFKSYVPKTAIHLCLLAATFSAYAPSLSAPFLFDDYIHLTNASREPLPVLLHRVLIQHPSGGDLFFRPAGALYYWLVFRLAAFHPFLWHLASLVIHMANVSACFVLFTRISKGNWLASTMGALLFAWQGAQVEAVCWLAAVFDLLAAVFSLSAILLATSLRSGFRISLAIAVFSAFACLSKESAYCLPLLIPCVALFWKEPDRRRILQQAIPATAGCAVVFLYRIWFLQSLGGYQSSANQSIAFHMQPVSILQALFIRIWGIFYLPVNWSQKPGGPLSGAAVVMLVTVCTLALSPIWSRRVKLAPALLFILSASLPVFPLLLIGSDLAGSRVLYLPLIGACMLWMLIINRVSKPVLAIVFSASIALFQLAALEHNQTIRIQVANLARQACQDTATLLKQYPSKTLSAVNLPKLHSGVYFLQNGFAPCVAINGGVEASRVRVSDSHPASSDLVVYWDETLSRMKTGL